MKYISILKDSASFQYKPEKVHELLSTTLEFLDMFGIPIDQTPRRLERMCAVFLACCDIKSINDFRNPKTLEDGYSLKTRDIINFVNSNFHEKISSGSYDDIRRKDLKLLVLSKLIIQSSPNSATNDSTRGYSLNPKFKSLVQEVGLEKWQSKVKKLTSKLPSLSETLSRKRNLDRIPVSLPSGKSLTFSQGKHNELQKKIIEEFLPIYGYEAEVLYVGDTDNKYLLVDQEALDKLNLFEISHDELPDIIAYSKSKDWIYFIEAVYSSGPISETRLLKLKSLSEKCKSDIVYVTAFLNKTDFRKFMSEIAWETEVWIADNPEHLIHFNGDKFLGPYK